MQDVVLNPVADPAHDLALLGFAAFLTAGLLLWTAARHGCTATRVTALFGKTETTLASLRGAMEARGRTEMGLLFFVLGSALLAGSQLLQEMIPVWVLPGGLFAIFVSAALFLVLHPLVSRARLRRQLRAYLRATPFSFEDNIALAREVGALFDVEPVPEETLESYVNKVRLAMGMPSPGNQAFRPERRI